MGNSEMQVLQTAPQDLRRTCARLCHASGVELEQIQFLLGHVSVQTTLPWLQAEFDQQSMIALASSRTLDVAALVVEGLPTSRSYRTEYTPREDGQCFAKGAKHRPPKRCLLD